MKLKPIDKQFVSETSDGGQKIVITKNSVNDDYKLFDVHYSDGSYAASIAWMGTSIKKGEQIMQPAVITNSPDTKYLSYDGQANFIGGQNQIIMPSNGSVYEIKSGQLCYFNNSDPTVPEKTYGLSYNNKSIDMDNVSIFNSDFSKGVMIELRSSMEGNISDGSTINGYVVILAKTRTIN